MTIALFVAAAGSLAILVLRTPAVVFRPSVWLLSVFLVQVGVAAAFVAVPEGPPMRDEAMARLLAVALPLPVAMWVLMTPSLTDRAARLFTRTRDSQLFSLRQVPEAPVLLLALGGTAVTLALLLRAVPLSETGLYTVFADPSRADVAREETYKLLDSRILQILLNVSGDVLVPIAGCAVLLLRLPTFAALVIKPAVTLLLLLASSPNGARGPMGMFLVTLGIAYVLRRGLARGAAMLAISGFLSLSLMVLLTIARSGTLDIADRFRITTVSDAILSRAFVSPLETGLWTLAYTERMGTFGLATITFPLKTRMGFPYVPLPSLVAGFHDPASMESAWMNTPFLFDFQASFGLWGGWLAAVAGVCALDLFLRAFEGWRGPLLVAFLATFYRALLDMVSTSYTTTLFGGIAMVVAAALVLQRLYRHRLAVPDAAVDA